MSTTKQFASINGPHEIEALFNHLCEKALLRSPTAVKKDLNLPTNHSPSIKDVFSLLRRHKELSFELKVSWPKVERTPAERKAEEKREMPDLNTTMPEPANVAEIKNQAGEIKDRELRDIASNTVVAPAKVEEAPKAEPSPLGNIPPLNL